jgi:PAT family acetyl-CoA transporter-like MFS transporter 1
MQWIRAMWFRIIFAITAMALVHYFPSPSDSSNEKVAAGGRNIPTYYFLLVIASTVLASFASTVQFVGISAFHTIIADPAVGGTYMTVSSLYLSIRIRKFPSAKR